MAAINIIKTDGPKVYMDLHLDTAYAIIRDTQMHILPDGSSTIVDFDSIDVIIEEYPLGPTGIPDMTTLIDIKRYNHNRFDLIPFKNISEPEYTSRYPLNKSFYKMTFRMKSFLDGPEPGNITHSKDTVITVNNFTNWVYSENFQDTMSGETYLRFKERNYMTIFGNLVPIGGATNDIQILDMSTVYCQEFTFDDFNSGELFSASFGSEGTSWWEIEVSNNQYNKHLINKDVKNFLSALFSTPGLQELITTKQTAFTANQISEVYGVTQPTENLYIPISFKINNEPYTIFLVGDFSFMDKIYLQG